MPGISGPLSKHFIEQWLHDTDCFIGVHDRKLSILGLCQVSCQLCQLFKSLFNFPLYRFFSFPQRRSPA